MPPVADGPATRWLDCRRAEGLKPVGDPLVIHCDTVPAARLQFGQFQANGTRTLARLAVPARNSRQPARKLAQAWPPPCQTWLASSTVTQRIVRCFAESPAFLGNLSSSTPSLY